MLGDLGGKLSFRNALGAEKGPVLQITVAVCDASDEQEILFVYVIVCA